MLCDRELRGTSTATVQLDSYGAITLVNFLRNFTGKTILFVNSADV